MIFNETFIRAPGTVTAVLGVVLSGCVPMTPSPYSAASPYGNAQGVAAQSATPAASRFARNNEQDEMLAQFKRAGKAILVVPTASLDSLHTDFNNNDSIADFLRLRSGTTEWTNTSRPSSMIKVGYDTKNRGDEDDPTHAYFQVVFGRTMYMIYLVDPGHYSISGVSYNLPRTPGFETPGARTLSSSPLGHAMLKSFTIDEFKRGQKWEDPSYRNATVQEDYCTSRRVVNNECTSWGTSSYDVKQQTSAGGWTPSIEQQTREARAVDVTLDKAFAAFDIAAGEVILIDGFFAEPPAATFKQNSCKQADQQQMRCELQQLSLVQLPGELEGVRQADNPADWGLPKLAQTLKGLTYRPLQIKAREAQGDSTWGPTYVLKAE